MLNSVFLPLSMPLLINISVNLHLEALFFTAIFLNSSLYICFWPLRSRNRRQKYHFSLVPALRSRNRCREASKETSGALRVPPLPATACKLLYQLLFYCSLRFFNLHYLLQSSPYSKGYRSAFLFLHYTRTLRHLHDRFWVHKH